MEKDRKTIGVALPALYVDQINRGASMCQVQEEVLRALILDSPFSSEDEFSILTGPDKLR